MCGPTEGAEEREMVAKRQVPNLMVSGHEKSKCLAFNDFDGVSFWLRLAIF